MWALINDERVTELTTTNPEGRYHVSWQWEPCDDRVKIGWRFTEAGFSEAPGPTVEAQIASERAWRDGELLRNEWLAARHRDQQDMSVVTSLSGEQFAQLLAFRQALRDWPEDGAFPEASGRPQPPEWLESAIRQ
jgi:hypothetical protein